MNVIVIEEEAFYKLIEEVVVRIKEKSTTSEDEWISGSEAMQKLRIKSKSTLQKLRDEGHIRFSQPYKKIILYDTNSIDEYLTKHAKEIFQF